MTDPVVGFRRLRAIALEAFKILSNQTPVYLSDLLLFKSHSYSFRYTNTVEVPEVRTSKYVSDPSTLLLLKCGILCHNSFEK